MVWSNPGNGSLMSQQTEAASLLRQRSRQTMIPLKDDAPRIGTPYVNYVLIVVNCAGVLSVAELAIAPAGTQTPDSYRLGVVPGAVHRRAVQPGLRAMGPRLRSRHALCSDRGGHPAVFTSMFLHGGWLHLIFNMWALWIFGDNVEDYLGHSLYLVLYFVSGVAAALLHTLFNIGSTIPSVGASGAIAGVMGAYFVLYPRARVLTLVPLFFVFFMWLPAWIVLGYWFIAQFLSGAATSISTHGGSSSGIAFWAHVGGFLAGMLADQALPCPHPALSLRDVRTGRLAMLRFRYSPESGSLVGAIHGRHRRISSRRLP